MKFTKRTIALFLGILMLVGIAPAIAAKGNENQVRIMTESEKKAATEELITFSDNIKKMEKKFPINPMKENMDDPYALARIIVKSKKKSDYAGSLAHVNGHNDLHIIQYKTPEEARKAVEKYNNMKGVEYAEPDIIMHINQEPHVDSFNSWGFAPEFTNAYAFAEKLLADNGDDVANLPEIIVAVLDSGIDYKHPYFKGRIAPGGRDFAYGDDNPQDDHGHGSHVAGTVCDGTLPNVKILPIKVLDVQGSGSSIDTSNGMEYAYLQGAPIANMSFGGRGSNKTEEDVINAGTDQGTIYCVSSGNAGEDASDWTPAYIERCCTVAACYNNKWMASFSNYGDCIDITAPGVNITSVHNGGGFCDKSGTSMACPHVAAACALLKSYDENLSPEDLMDNIRNMAEPFDYPYGGGAGVLHLDPLGVTPPQPTGEPGQPTDAPYPTQTPIPTTTPEPSGKIGFYFETLDDVKKWEILDVDGDSLNWEWVNNDPEDSPEGSGYMISYSKQSLGFFVDQLEPDNWLISPEIPGGGTATFRLKSFDPEYPGDLIEVYTCTMDGTTPVLKDQLGSFITPASTNYETRTFDLSAYAGQNIKLVFRHTTNPFNNGFAVILDALEVLFPDGTEPVNPTAAPTQVPTPEPTEVPTPEPTEVPTPEPTSYPEPLYTVTFHRNDGSGDIFTTIENVAYGALIEEPSPAPELDGYRFDGWYKSDMVTKWNFAADTVTEDLDLYAKWIKLYTVSFNPGGGTLPQGAIEPQQGPLAQGESFIIPPCPYEKANCSFECWTDGTNEYSPSDLYTMPGKDVTLTAVWRMDILPGDSDCNGIVDMSDAILALRVSIGLTNLSEQGLANADIDSDGIITATDAVYITRLALGV